MQHTIAVDLAKSVFQVAESSRPGRVNRPQRLTRRKFEQFIGQCPPSRFLFEACGSAHYWARRVQAAGHTAALLPPHRVSRYRVGDKTDRADAKALLEADRNEEIRPVPVKTPDQQCLASLHRLRSGYVTTRTARINAIRGILREYGVTIPVGARKVAPAVRALEKDGVPIPVRTPLIHGARTVLTWAGRKQSPTPRQQWMLQVECRRGRNIAAVALANKTARVAWAVATQNRPFRP